MEGLKAVGGWVVGKSRENAEGKGKREGKLGPVVGHSNEKLSAGEKGPRHGENVSGS